MFTLTADHCIAAFAILCLVGVIILGAPEVLREIRAHQMRKMFKKNINLWFPTPLLCRNAERGVTAICNYANFQRVADAQFASAGSDPLQSARPIEVWTPNTFTFAENEQILRPIHTGTKEGLEKILAELVVKVTSRTIAEWEKIGVKSQLRDKIVVDDKRLFVPFAGHTPQIERQLQTFRKRYPEELRETLGLS